MSEADVIRAAGDAIVARQQAQDSIEAATETLHECMRALYHEHGESAQRTSDLITEELLRRGFTADSIRGLGISHDRVRQVAGSRRRPRPT